MLGMSLANYAKIEQGKTKVTTEKLEAIAEKFDTNILELLTQGEKNTFYIQENSGDNNSYIAHNTLPANYQALKVEKEKVDLENKFLREKVALLEDKIKNLEKVIATLESQKD